MHLPPQAPIPQTPRTGSRISSRPDLTPGNVAAAPPTHRLSPSQPLISAGARASALRRFWDGWLRLVAPPLRGMDPTAPVTRALQRRRSLASALLFGLFILWTALAPVSVALYPQGLSATLVVIAIGYLTLLSVGWLIRRGWVTGAAMILIALIFLGFVAIQLSETHEALERATAFYLLLYPILLAATLMPAEALFITLTADLFLVAASALIIWPPAIRLQSIASAQVANVYAWPVAALMISTIVAYIWTSGMQRATAQAEFAQAEAILSRMSETNAHDALEHDVRELMRVVDAWSSGNLGAQVGQLASPDLRRVAIALSGYASRVRTLAREEYDFQRERDAVRRITEALLYLRQGLPATWPMAAGLPADLITRAIMTNDPAAMLAELNSHNT